MASWVARIFGGAPNDWRENIPALAQHVKRRRQRYSIVSGSSFDYFKLTGDDFASKLMSEIASGRVVSCCDCHIWDIKETRPN